MPGDGMRPGDPPRALIFSGGEVRDYSALRRLLRPTADDLVVCADRGLLHAQALGLMPHLVLGDFDSLPGGLQAAMASGAHVEQVPRAKDETDTHLALRAAVAQGARRLVLAGGIGSRLDHTVANLLLAPGLPDGFTLTLVNEQNLVHVLPPGKRLILDGGTGGFVSLLPLSPTAAGIDTTGLRWSLAGATLAWGESRGVSNEIEAPHATVQCRAGWLLVIQAWDPTDL